MTLTREEMIKRLSERSGYYQKDVRNLLQCMDDIVFEALCKVTSDEEVSVQILKGAKFSTRLVPQRERVDPRDGKSIICQPTVKVACKFSRDMKLKLQEAYDKQNG